MTRFTPYVLKYGNENDPDLFIFLIKWLQYYHNFTFERLNIYTNHNCVHKSDWLSKDKSANYLHKIYIDYLTFIRAKTKNCED